MQKLLKAYYFMNRMHEYEMKCSSKTHVLNPDFPKIRFSISYVRLNFINHLVGFIPCQIFLYFSN